MADTIEDIIWSKTLPTDPEGLIEHIGNPDGSFVPQEGVNWDFKESWPFSYSDPYFAGLCRLICAFYNTRGGIIIFGVNDTTRLSVDSKIKPNIDKFQLALNQITNEKIEIIFKSYETKKHGKFQILLVSRKPTEYRPAKFIKKIGGYEADIIWIRSFHEVIEATATDIQTLYCSGNNDKTIFLPKADLPPNPATIREFVGRMECIDQIFYWIKSSDQPRLFLYGRGGSGKSTIAYQVASALKNSSYPLRIEGQDVVEQVIFTSAKSKFLNVETATQEKFTFNDFEDEKSLYLSILSLGGFSVPNHELDDISKLKIHIKEFFNTNSCFLVIDDIDTLTTAGKESGMEFLQGVLYRSPKRSKVLYTVRGRVPQAIESSIEVPGLSDGEYAEFLEMCCRHFRVEKPSEVLRLGAISQRSERRPLVIECIVALRRNAASYEMAIDLLNQSDGDDVREYVFDREWNAISIDSNGREILAILCRYGKKLSFQDLTNISMMDISKVKDAIGEIQDMFLVAESDGEETYFELGELTKSYISKVSKTLDRYSTVEARVDYYKSTFYPDNPEISGIEDRVRRAAYQASKGECVYISDQWTALNSNRYGPRISEDPRFLSIRGYAGLIVGIDNLAKCRKDFENAFKLKYCPDIDFIRIWFDAESSSDLGDRGTEAIVNFVLNGKGYNKNVKCEFMSRRAQFLYYFAKNNITLDTEKSIQKLRQAILLHLSAWKLSVEVEDRYAEKTWLHAKNTMYLLVNNLQHGSSPDLFLDFVKDCADKKKGLFVDPLWEPALFLFRRLASRFGLDKADLQRISGKLEQLQRLIRDKGLWYDIEAKEFFDNGCLSIQSSLKQQMKAAK